VVEKKKKKKIADNLFRLKKKPELAANKTKIIKLTFNRNKLAVEILKETK
jgi:hypothetical protein